MQRSETERDAEVAAIAKRMSEKLDELRELDRDLLRAMGFPEAPGVPTDNGNSGVSEGPIPRTKPEQRNR